MGTVVFVEDDFTSATTGKKNLCRVCIVAVSGTFSGTLKLKWTDQGGTTHTVQESGADLEFTAAGERVLNFGVPIDVYWECTSYTSGTAKASITGEK